MDQLISLALAMPPVVSAFLSLVTMCIIWFGGKRIRAPIMAVLASQSVELKAQSKDLVDIKLQTARTNGKVLALEGAFETHERLDEEHHEDTKAGLLHNRTTLHKLRDQLSEFAIKVGLQAKRINTRDDKLGIGSHEEGK